MFDAKSFKRIITNKVFAQESLRILASMANTTSKIATNIVDGHITAPMRNVRMIAVKKPNGGIRAIGVGEVVRRIVTKV